MARRCVRQPPAIVERLLGIGHSDADGNATLLLDAPANTRAGNRLVTVGASAVSADCPLIITDGESTPGGVIDVIKKCCEKLKQQIWIVIVLLALIALLMILLLMRRRG